jgi:hypothetical protein
VLTLVTHSTTPSVSNKVCNPHITHSRTHMCVCVFRTLISAVNLIHEISILGSSIGDCDNAELKSLLKTLKIDIRNLSTKQSQRDGTKAFPDVELPKTICPESSNPSPNQQINLAELPSAEVTTTENANNHNANDDDANTNDEMLEITPEVQMFLGNHFLAGENGQDNEADEPKTPAKSSMSQADATSMIEQSMARHNEMTRTKYQLHENGIPDVSVAAAAAAALTNGLHHQVHWGFRNKDALLGCTCQNLKFTS